ERVAELGGLVHLGETVRGIAPAAEGGFDVATDRRAGRFDAVVATLPTRVALPLIAGLPEDFRARHDWGLAYGAHCVVLELDRRLMRPYWLCLNDPGFPYLAAVEHTNLLPAADYGGKHLLYLGNYLPHDHPLFRRADD